MVRLAVPALALLFAGVSTALGMFALVGLVGFDLLPDTITAWWLGAAVAALPIGLAGLWFWVPAPARTRALVHVAASVPISALILIALFPSYPDHAPPERLGVLCLLPVCLAYGRALWIGARSRSSVMSSDRPPRLAAFVFLTSLPLVPLAVPLLSRGASECVPLRIVDLRASSYSDPIGNGYTVVGFKGTADEAAHSAACLGAEVCKRGCDVHTPVISTTWPLQAAPNWRPVEPSTETWIAGDDVEDYQGFTAEYFDDGWIQLQEWSVR